MATILIVEDHAMSRQILVTLLEFAGHRILEAAEGEGALALACSGCPDLIICDILLPTMDGREFVRGCAPRQLKPVHRSFFIPPGAVIRRIFD